MTARVWDRFLTVADRAHLARAEPKRPYGFGDKTALISVDNCRAAIGDARRPMLDSMTEWPSNTGLAGWVALDRIAELLAAVRDAGVPVIHVTGTAVIHSRIGGWLARRGEVAGDPEARDRHRRCYDIVDQASPLSGELVLAKTGPSAFFGTPLLAHLIGERIDTLLVVGQAVSGCVRATVVDGCSNRLRMLVVEECVYDRHEATRAMNLFDIDQKYGDVISFTAAMEWVAGQREHQTPAERPKARAHGEAAHVPHSHLPAAHAGPSEQAHLPLPHVVTRQLPGGAEPLSVSEHPISGHVLRRAGDSVLDAARQAMAAGFGTTRSVIAILTAENVEPSDDDRYRSALDLTGGGAIILGVGYAPATRPASRREIDPGPCPECGSYEATVEDYIEPSGTPGMHNGAVVFFCPVCATEWDMPAT